MSSSETSNQITVNVEHVYIYTNGQQQQGPDMISDYNENYKDDPDYCPECEEEPPYRPSRLKNGACRAFP